LEKHQLHDHANLPSYLAIFNIPPPPLFRILATITSTTLSNKEIL
jgi:hypothetical protein